MHSIGATNWVIAGARMPAAQQQEPGRLPQVPKPGGDGACILNAGPRTAEVSITLYFANDGPRMPPRLTVPSQSMRYVDFATLAETIGENSCCAVFTSDEPVVVQHMHGDIRATSRWGSSTPAYAELSR